MSDVHPDLEWIAKNTDKWGGTLIRNLVFVNKETGQADYCSANYYNIDNVETFTHPQYIHARHVLGLDDHVMTPEEAELPAEEHRNKYMREIKPGVWVDVYDVLAAWDVRNPALQHLIKKALAPGQRGHKTIEQDMNDIVASAVRARELEK